jgi:hypothetical protein
MRRLFTVIGVSSVLLTGLGISAAFGADAQANSCPAGQTEVGPVAGMLTNGELDAVFCMAKGADDVIRKVHVEYLKKAGEPVSVTFGWRLTGTAGNNPGAPYWADGVADTVKVGETKSHDWQYEPGIVPPSAQQCLQGLMRDEATGRTFFTEAACG